MRARSVSILPALVIMALAAAPLHAKLGIGVHWGLDWSVDMDDTQMEQLVFDDLVLDSDQVGGTAPGDMNDTTIPGDKLPIYIDRTGFQRTVIDFGGKILIDALRYFEVEVSTNFGLWEYDGKIIYPTSLSWSGASYENTQSPEDLYTIDYDTLAVTPEALGVPYWGLDKTPYAKIHFDATIRKSFLKIPKRLKTFSLYAGGGLSLHFATPMLSAELIENAIADQLAQADSTLQALGPNLLGSEDIMKAVLDQITAGLSEPKFGIHFVAGTQIKIPVLPIAFYLDGKWMIPFGQMDEYVDVNGHGFLVNGGIMLKF